MLNEVVSAISILIENGLSIELIMYIISVVSLSEDDRSFLIDTAIEINREINKKEGEAV